MHTPFWGPTTVWGKKSIFAMNDREVEIAKAERDRNRLRFSLLMFIVVPALFSLLLYLATS